MHTKHSIDINAPAEKAWQAITDKEIIKQYMFGTETVSNWNKGDTITYTGTYNGMEYKDGGIILDIIPGQLLKHTYWSSMSGVEDKPENYSAVTYTITANGNKCSLTAEQEDYPTQTMYENSDKHWPMILQSIKELLEKQ